MTAKAVFLDKDGTLLEDIPYNVDPERIRLVDGAFEGLRLLQDHGYQLIVVTNQSGVARGFFEEHDLHAVRRRLRELLAEAGIFLTDLYYCPHHPEGTVAKYAVECFCRKPQPGMLYRAALEHEIRLADSWVVGDILHDVEAGNRAGCRTILINNRRETEWDLSTVRRPRFIVKNLESAARSILSGSLVETEAHPWHERILTF
jgi:D-glycero-D-manno-heptose 1,7-bisphosphate phosphatase